MLNPFESARKNELLNKFNSYHTLTIGEANELKSLVQRDNMDNAVKLFILFAIGIIIAAATAHH